MWVPHKCKRDGAYILKTFRLQEENKHFQATQHRESMSFSNVITGFQRTTATRKVNRPQITWVMNAEDKDHGPMCISPAGWSAAASHQTAAWIWLLCLAPAPASKSWTWSRMTCESMVGCCLVRVSGTPPANLHYCNKAIRPPGMM